MKTINNNPCETSDDAMRVVALESAVKTGSDIWLTLAGEKTARKARIFRVDYKGAPYTAFYENGGFIRFAPADLHEIRTADYCTIIYRSRG